MSHNRPYRLTIAVDTRSAARRSILSGIFRATANSSAWDVAVLSAETPLTPRTVASLAEKGTDGLIAAVVNEQATLDALARQSFKTVILETATGLIRPDTPNIRYFDNSLAGRATGALGLRHLHAAGNFRHYAFVMASEDRPWSRNRAAGFVEAAKELRLDCSVLPTAESGDDSRLCQFIAGLPRPAAVMGAFDAMGVNILSACRRMNLSVPGMIAVLGVDDDVLLCENVRPSLSSIRIDHEQIGEDLVSEMRRLLSGRGRARTTFEPSRKANTVMVRESTRAPVPAAELIRRALDYIAANATDGIGIRDVARHLGISPRLLFLRFSQLHTRSVLAEINDRRLKAAKQLLRETGKTTAAVAKACGFGSVRAMERCFLTAEGLSPAQYRRNISAKRT